MSTDVNLLKKAGLTKAKALDMLQQMWEIRMFEDTVYDLLGKNLIRGRFAPLRRSGSGRRRRDVNPARG